MLKQKNEYYFRNYKSCFTLKKRIDHYIFNLKTFEDFTLEYCVYIISILLPSISLVFPQLFRVISFFLLLLNTPTQTHTHTTQSFSAACIHGYFELTTQYWVTYLVTHDWKRLILSLQLLIVYRFIGRGLVKCPSSILECYLTRALNIGHKEPCWWDFMNAAPCHVENTVWQWKLRLNVGGDKFSVVLSNLFLVSLNNFISSISA